MSCGPSLTCRPLALPPVTPLPRARISSILPSQELFAGFAAAEADKLIETHGLNEFDKLRVQHQAAEQFNENTYQYYN
jgi:hypothetical protein